MLIKSRQEGDEICACVCVAVVMGVLGESECVVWIYLDEEPPHVINADKGV